MIKFTTRKEIVTLAKNNYGYEELLKEVLDYLSKHLESMQTPPKVLENYSALIGGDVFLIEHEDELAQIPMKEEIKLTDGFSYEYCKRKFDFDVIEKTESFIVVMPIVNNEGGPLYFIPHEVFCDIRRSI